MPARDRWIALGLVAVAAWTPGCNKRITLRQVPEFYDPSIRTVAVADLANNSLRTNAGRYVATRLADALAVNQTYGVIGPDEFRTQLDQAGLDLPAGADRQRLCEILARLDHIDAILTGEVLSLETERIVESYRPRGYVHTGYAWSSYGYHGPRTGIGLHLPLQTQDIRAAFAEARFRMVHREGNVLAVVGPVSAERQVQSSAAGPGELLDAVVREVADKAVARVAIVPVEVEVDPDDALRVGVEAEGGKVDWTETVDISAGELIVHVELPEQADRNELSLRIRRKGQGEALASQSFTYRIAQGPIRRVFALGELVDRGGKGAYQVVLVRKGDTLLTKTFDIN